MANENRTQDAGHALLRQGRNPKVRKNSGVIIPLRNIASVDTNTKFNPGSFVWGVVFFVAGLACLSDSAAVGILLILLAAANLANTMSA